jgi:uncharacterized phiE125 gp8 family phage protein
MWDRIERLTQPAVEPLSLAEAKAHCKVDSADEDAFFARAIRAARELIEGPDGAGIALVASQWEMRLDQMPAEIRVPMGPVLSIDGVAWLDEAGNLQTIAADRYQWRKGRYEARIMPAPGSAWPAVRCRYDAVHVAFTAGFPGTEAETPDMTAIPEPLRVAMLMLIGHWHETRETVAMGQITAEIQLGFNDLGNRHRVGRFA